MAGLALGVAAAIPAAIGPATGAALTALVATTANRPVALTAANQVQNLAVAAQIS